jgi:hypothetical protein
MSRVCSASPREKMIAWFWFSGLPSPTIGSPGSWTRKISTTAPDCGSHRISTEYHRIVSVSEARPSSPTVVCICCVLST